MASLVRGSGFVSFGTTTNERAKKASKLKVPSHSMRGVIQNSKSFKAAFEDDKPGIIIQSSAHRDDMGCTANYGLVSAILTAYNDHVDLTLRPDDLWQAILTQLSFYINHNAEALRDRFVDFEGKKTLVIAAKGTLFTADFGSFARRMVDEQIVNNIKDATVVDWLLPGFTTTTVNDRVAAAVSIMSTLQTYFEYVCYLSCGIPHVTLFGDAADWRRLRGKIDKLLEYDLDDSLMSKWHALLAPVLDEFVKSAAGNPDIEFWDRVCSHHGGGSGPSYLSGWVTVFAVFDSKGGWKGSLDVRGFGMPKNPKWPVIETQNLPVGVVSVPVLVDDNGVQYDTKMLAGHFSYEESNKGTCVMPRIDWCIAYTGEKKATPRDYHHGEVRKLTS